MALASFCLWIKVSANPAFRFAKLWKSVEQLQHFDSKAYCFVMCGLGFSDDLTYHWPIAGNYSRHLEDNMNLDVVSSPWAACAHEDWIS